KRFDPRGATLLDDALAALIGRAVKHVAGDCAIPTGSARTVELRDEVHVCRRLRRAAWHLGGASARLTGIALSATTGRSTRGRQVLASPLHACGERPRGFALVPAATSAPLRPRAGRRRALGNTSGALPLRGGRGRPVCSHTCPAPRVRSHHPRSRSRA